MLLDFNGIGPEFTRFSGPKDCSGTSTIGAKLLPMQGWRRRLGKVIRRSRAGSFEAGNPRLRTTLIQLAWLWLRHQPQSALALWFKERVARNGGRHKKTTIVALARKLLVALWKYVTAGVVIEGADDENRLTIVVDQIFESSRT